ncbi:DNA polymerase II large subunit [Candidatus Micrarchaeota archaeon]|nr:DNA polymerase II large subunit [Candidatus Micrarchaeota archaeon]
MEKYFDGLNAGLERAYAVAGKALALGFDASLEPEIKRAADVAARVEGIVGPKGIAEGIRALEAGGLERELVAVELVKQICSGKYFQGSKEELINQAVRTGVAVLTEGVLVAPTEGISKIKIRDNPDGSNYLSLYFSGPIRSAGGTAAAQSVVLADVARSFLGVADYRPTESEIERYVEEMHLYDSRAARLQYKPPDDDLRWVVRNCPVCVDGDPTEEFEVSVHKNLARVETNRVRGGISLVTCEGIAQKSAKLLKYTKKIGLNWSWLEKIIKIAKKEGKSEVKPNESFLDDIVAGRPIFCYPSAKGGLRLRYGRTRATGIAAKAMHPASMILLDCFPAVGTQLKIEQPGKGCVVAPCDSIEGPVVKLENGDVVRIDSVSEAMRLKGQVVELLFLGDLLVSFGDFLKSNHPLVPAGYCEEWWEKEFLKACGEKNKTYDVPRELSARRAFELSRELGVPLHPKHTFFWHDISIQQLKELAEWLSRGRMSLEWFDLKSFSLEYSPAKRVLEELCVPHSVSGGNIVFSPGIAFALLSSLGLLNGNDVSLEEFVKKFSEEKTVLELVNELSGVRVRAKAPTYVGARMGRPEKARERWMESKPSALFPVGGYGGKMRSLVKAFKSARDRSYGSKNLNLELARLKCVSCGSVSFWHSCEKCGARCVPQCFCSKCGAVFDDVRKEECGCGGQIRFSEVRSVDFVSLFEEAERKCKHSLKELKGVKGMTSKLKAPERLEKGLLRAKHDIFVFKDGTCRFDSTNMMLTHFYPREVGVRVEKLRELGYTIDFEGKPLESEDQLVELKPQDIIISEHGGDYMMRVSNFVDDLIVYAYNEKPFFNAKSREDLIGQLMITLSPHTSAGVLCRLIGFTKAFVGYCHPYIVSARRRNCDGDEDCCMLLLDALLNFSKSFLPETRGGTMDAPLVLSTIIDPKEVDDEVHAMEVCSSFPLEFYEAAMNFASPSEVKVERVRERLGKINQYYDLRFTHHSSSIQEGPLRTSYVELKSMSEKINRQFNLCNKIRAVNARDSAERVILSHFLPDLYGNLRSFSRQTFRCVDCNLKYRRVPLAGKCLKCGGKLLLTIHKGGIEKYLELSKKLIDDYELPNYLKQRMLLLEKDIKSIFEDEVSKQFNLAEFM